MSKALERMLQYQDEDLDIVLLRIKSGTIKCGRFSHLVKVKGAQKVPKKGVLFDDVRSNSKSGSGKS